VLTSRGWGLLVAGVVLAVLTRLTGATELLVLAVPAFVLPVLALAWSRVSFRIGVRRWVEPASVVRGEPCIGALAVTNLGGRRSPVLDVVDRRGDDELAILVPRLAAAEVHPTTYHLPTDRRGVFALGPLTAERGDVFGLARTTVDLGGRMTFAVHPRHHDLVGPPGGVRASPDGSIQQIPFGSSVFDGLREYVIGDDHRKIHWLSSARTGTPLVRVYRDSSIPTLSLLLDDRASRYRGDRFEDAVEVAASVLDLADRFDLSLVVVTTSGASAGRVGERVDRADLLDFLAGVTLQDDDAIAAGGDGGPPFDPTRHPPAATVLLITGALTPADAGAVLTLKSSVARLTTCTVVPDEAPSTVPSGVAGVQVSQASQLPARWAEVLG
jgi:uncharacterized protein (DUF58 family)